MKKKHDEKKKLFYKKKKMPVCVCFQMGRKKCETIRNSVCRCTMFLNTFNDANALFCGILHIVVVALTFKGSDHLHRSAAKSAGPKKLLDENF